MNALPCLGIVMIERHNQHLSTVKTSDSVLALPPGAYAVVSEESRAAVAGLIEAADFVMQPGTDITSSVKLEQSRARIHAALAACGVKS